MKRFALLFAFLFLLAGCSHKPARVSVAPPPPIEQRPVATPHVEPSEMPDSADSIAVPLGTKPLLVETGVASWYGPPYHNRRASNGEVYNMRAMTAAHRTLPLGSIVRVTNLKSGDAVIVRITDRGPFIPGRVVDLSQAAAEKVGLIKSGVARVKVELVKTPLPVDQGGRWAVQIGAFQEEDPARALSGRLSRRYQTAKVLCFSSPVGDWWVRVRVQHDERTRAEALVHETSTPEGSIFLVRLD